MASNTSEVTLETIQALSHERDKAAYRVVGGVDIAISTLDRGDLKEGLAILRRSLAHYEAADAALKGAR